MASLFRVEGGGKVLEPSAGAGDLVRLIEKRESVVVDGVELDSTITPACTTKLVYSDFFSYSQGKENSYNGIIGNPPYVAWKELEKETQLSAIKVKENYSDKCNLYYLFMDRCIDLLAEEGEMVFIVPKEWLYTSSAEPLRQKMMRTGRLTHIVDCGEEKLFTDADVPALLIFRFVKKPVEEHSTYLVSYAMGTESALSHKYVEYVFSGGSGCFILLPKGYKNILNTWGTLGDHFEVKVGIVSGADSIFRLPKNSQIEPSCIKKYLTTKGVEEFIDVNDYSCFSDIPINTRTYLAQHKEALMSRRIDSFDETNWWKYGAVRNKNAMLSDAKRFYSYVKTRKPNPFFIEANAELYGGGILGLFQKSTTDISISDAVLLLNSFKYRRIFEAMFLATGNKLSLQPSTLSNMLFPAARKQLVEWLA